MLTNEDIVKRYTGPFTLNQVISFNIPFIEEDDILATLDGVALNINSDYSVTPITSDGLIIGADVTLLKAFPNGNTLVLERRTDATQEQDYPENGPFESTDIERSLDKLTMLIQEGRHKQSRFIEINLEEKDDFDNMLPKANENRQIVVVTEDEATLVDVDPQEIQDAIDKCQELVDEAEASATQAENCATQSCQCASAAEDAKDAAIAAQEAAEAAKEAAEEAAGNAGTSAGDLQQAVADAEAAADAAENAADIVEDIYNQVKDLVLDYEPPLEIEEDTVTTPDNIDTDSGVTITSNVATGNGSTQYGMVYVDFGTEINLRTDTFEFSLAFVDNSGDLDNSTHDEDRTSFISLSTNASAESTVYGDIFALLDYTYATAAPYLSTGYRASEESGSANVIEKLKDITYGAKTTVKFEGLATNPATVKVTVTDSAGTQTRTIPVEEDGAKSTFKSVVIQLGTPTSTGTHIPNRDISLYLTDIYLKVNNVDTWAYQPATSTTTSTLTLNYGSGLTLSGNTLVTDPSVVTMQGNTFNTANKLVRLDSQGKLPALDGSNLINVSGGGGDQYVLPPATTTTLGGVKPDGTTITVTADGTISAKEFPFDEVEYPLYIETGAAPLYCVHNWTQSGNVLTQGDNLPIQYMMQTGNQENLDADLEIYGVQPYPQDDTYTMDFYRSFICIPYQLGQVITTDQSGSGLSNCIKRMAFGYFNSANQFVPVWLADNAGAFVCKLATSDTPVWDTSQTYSRVKISGDDGIVDLDNYLYSSETVTQGGPIGFQLYRAESNGALHFVLADTSSNTTIRYLNVSNRRSAEAQKITHALILPYGTQLNIQYLGLYNNTGLNTTGHPYPWLTGDSTWEMLGTNLLDFDTLKETLLFPDGPTKIVKTLCVDSYSKEEVDDMIDGVTSSLATVATTGSYTDLLDKPTIPEEYVLPTASTTTLGGVKVDGSTVTITQDGVISAVSSGGGSGGGSLNLIAQSPLEITTSEYRDLVTITGDTFQRNVIAPATDAVTTVQYETIGAYSYISLPATIQGNKLYPDRMQMISANILMTDSLLIPRCPYSNMSANKSLIIFGRLTDTGELTHLGYACISGPVESNHYFAANYYEVSSVINSASTNTVNGVQKVSLPRSNEQTASFTPSSISFPSGSGIAVYTFYKGYGNGLTIRMSLRDAESHAASITKHFDFTSFPYEDNTPNFVAYYSQSNHTYALTDYQIANGAYETVWDVSDYATEDAIKLNYDETLTLNSNNELTVNTAGLNIPTSTSQLTNDSGFITNTVDNLTNYTPTSSLATVATTGSYTDLVDKPDIPAEYELPAATTSALGGVKPDGSTITVTSDGTISAASSAPTNMVTTDTEQTITAPKTLNANLKLGAGNAIISADDLGNRNVITTNGIVTNIGNTTDQTIINGQSVVLNRWDNTVGDYDEFDLIDSGNISSYAATTTQGTNADTAIANLNGFKFWAGTTSLYEAIETKDDSTLYFCYE